MDTYRHGEIGSMRISYRHKERERERVKRTEQWTIKSSTGECERIRTTQPARVQESDSSMSRERDGVFHFCLSVGIILYFRVLYRVGTFCLAENRNRKVMSDRDSK